MYIIGISAYYHDSSVSLFRNGQLVFACEEEKFTGVKHDSRFPIKALEYITKSYKLNKDNIEAVCYYEDPKLKLKRVWNNIKPQIIKNPIYSIKSYLKAKNNVSKIHKELKAICDNVFYSTHHESHQYYSFYTSNFIDSVILSIDGVGEIDTMSIGLGDNHGIDYVSISQYPHSLGFPYDANPITLYSPSLGLKPRNAVIAE